MDEMALMMKGAEISRDLFFIFISLTFGFPQPGLAEKLTHQILFLDLCFFSYFFKKFFGLFVISTIFSRVKRLSEPLLMKNS